MQRREMLKITSAALFGLAGLPVRWAMAANQHKPKVLYFTQSAGYEHSVVCRQAGQPSHSERVLAELGQRAGFEVQSSKDGRVFDGDLSRYDAIVFYTSGDLTGPNKDGTPPMSPQGKQRLLDAVAAGKGFVGFHAAADTFHSQGGRFEAQSQPDPYIAMLGGEAIAHGPQQEVSLLLTSRFPGLRELGCAEGLSFYEEWYAMKHFAKDLHVTLLIETEGMEGDCYRRPPYPAAWARMHGRGRVFYTCLGHREDVWTNPFFQSIALGGLAWAMGAVEADVKPNLDKIAPHANELRAKP